MGLDMYLYAERYVSGYPHQADLERNRFKVLAELLQAEELVAEHSPSCTIQFTCAYWRKANAIHGWFVRTVQNDVDDCGEYEVEREQLIALRELCAELLAAREDSGATSWAELCLQKLPPQEGFFFGSTDTDDYYADDLRDTVAQLDRILKVVPNNQNWLDGWSFKYHSSW